MVSRLRAYYDHLVIQSYDYTSTMSRPLYTIPIKERPYHGSLWCKIFFPIVFIAAQIGINSLQFLAVPLLLIPYVGRRAFRRVIDYTKDGYGRLSGSMFLCPVTVE